MESFDGLSDLGLIIIFLGILLLTGVKFYFLSLFSFTVLDFLGYLFLSKNIEKSGSTLRNGPFYFYVTILIVGLLGCLNINLDGSWCIYISWRIRFDWYKLNSDPIHNHWISYIHRYWFKKHPDFTSGNNIIHQQSPNSLNYGLANQDFQRFEPQNLRRALSLWPWRWDNLGGGSCLGGNH